jgi:periplasmic divalent cation tolerance protein
MSAQYRFIYVTAGNMREAGKIGARLVEERLAACVNIFPIRSVYRWKGKTQREKETAMIIKTRRGLVDRVIQRVKELHTYEVPCVVALGVEEGSADFLRWIDESTGKTR